MRSLIALLAALSLTALTALPASAQEKKEQSAAQKKQQERMKDCNERAGLQKLEGDARKKFMSGCLKGEPEMKSRSLRG